jgi:activator of the mannose operon (transcriptional antiterminator)
VSGTHKDRKVKVMNDRQKAMLKILLESDLYYMSSQRIADLLGCSEKTVRNDSKALDEWLSEHSHATLSRKPNIGFRLEISDSERNSLLNSLYQLQFVDQEVEEKDRLARILEILLVEKKTVTLQKLAELFYVNKAIIKKDLEKIEAFLEQSNLNVTTKRKSGVEVDGNEQNWRLAISRIPAFIGAEPHTRLDFFKYLFIQQEIKAVQQSLEEFNKTLSNPYTDETIMNLTIHILISIKRLKLGHSMPLATAEVADLKKTKEFQYALNVMKRLNPMFAIKFPENEIAYIALHFMGGRVQKAIQEKTNPEISFLVQRIVSRISMIVHVDFAQDQELFLGLQVHLQSTMNRIKHGLSVTNPILDEIKRMFPYLFDTIMNELFQLNKEIGTQIPEEEAAYLTLHFQASVERLQKKSGQNKRVIIVCPMGIGASVLLRTKLERKFHSLDIIDTVSSKNIQQYLQQKIDFIISTVPISNPPVPVIVVTPLLSAEEENRLQSFIEGHNDEKADRTGKDSFPQLQALLNENLILLNLDFEHRFEVIEALAAELTQEGYVEKACIESAVIRERHSSTSIGGGIAIPHGDPSLIKNSVIAVGVLKKPLLWGKEYVSLVLFLATKQGEYRNTKELFKEIGQLCDQPLTVNTLTKQKTAKDFMHSLG